MILRRDPAVERQGAVVEDHHVIVEPLDTRGGVGGNGLFDENRRFALGGRCGPLFKDKGQRADRREGGRNFHPRAAAGGYRLDRVGGDLAGKQIAPQNLGPVFIGRVGEDAAPQRPLPVPVGIDEEENLPVLGFFALVVQIGNREIPLGVGV